MNEIAPCNYNITVQTSLLCTTADFLSYHQNATANEMAVEDSSPANATAAASTSDTAAPQSTAVSQGSGKAGKTLPVSSSPTRDNVHKEKATPVPLQHSQRVTQRADATAASRGAASAMPTPSRASTPVSSASLSPKTAATEGERGTASATPTTGATSSQPRKTAGKKKTTKKKPKKKPKTKTRKTKPPKEEL